MSIKIKDKIKDKIYNFENINAIVGLGNPGHKYFNTRHNIGFRVLDSIAEKYLLSWQENSAMSYCQVPGKKLFLVKPNTFMNNSGNVIPFFLKKGITGENILVVHDELEKPFGKINIRWDGSARGHNGLRSIESVIGKDFWRLRFGIGRPVDKRDVGNYVLSRFSKEEEDLLEELIEEAIQIANCCD